MWDLTLRLSIKKSLSLAALCHDLDHPGVNNDFLINSADPFALLHDDFISHMVI